MVLLCCSRYLPTLAGTGPFTRVMLFGRVFMIAWILFHNSICLLWEMLLSLSCGVGRRLRRRLNTLDFAASRAATIFRAILEMYRGCFTLVISRLRSRINSALVGAGTWPIRPDKGARMFWLYTNTVLPFEFLNPYNLCGCIKLATASGPNFVTHAETYVTWERAVDVRDRVKGPVLGSLRFVGKGVLPIYI